MNYVESHWQFKLGWEKYPAFWGGQYGLDIHLGFWTLNLSC